MTILGYFLLVPVLFFNHDAELKAQEEQSPDLKKTTRTVVLIRHAKSSHTNPEWQDFERPLGERGYRDAPFMGQKIFEKGIKFDLIIASPSQRTTETIQLICKEIDYPVEKVLWDQSVYLSSTENLLTILRNLDDTIKTVGIVGHNPSMTETANTLQKKEKIENVPTSGIVSVSFSLENWSDLNPNKGKLNFFIYPKKYTK
jgi:phosphohistidine phosphatase